MRRESEKLRRKETDAEQDAALFIPRRDYGSSYIRRGVRGELDHQKANSRCPFAAHPLPCSNAGENWTL